jgi:hypothetical protein
MGSSAGTQTNQDTKSHCSINMLAGEIIHFILHVKRLVLYTLDFTINSNMEVMIQGTYTLVSGNKANLNVCGKTGI